MKSFRINLTYLWTLLAVIVISMIGKLLPPYFSHVNVALLYILPVLISAVYWGRGPSFFASLLGVLAFDFFFVPPLYSFAVDDIRFLFTFSVYLIVAGVTSTIASSLHSQLDKAKKSELLTRTLYDVSRQMVVLTDSQKILEIFAQRIAENMRGKIIFLLPDSQNDRLTEAASSPFGSVLASEDERGIAQWVLAHGRGAGKGTGIIGNSSALFLPVKAENRTLAVLAIIPAEGDDPALPERYTLLEAFTNLAAVGLIRVALAQEAQRASWLAQSEKLHSALLNSVSHEIRTPLSSITGAVTSLLERIGMDHESRDTLLCTIKEEAQRMNRFVSNLLDMTRLESGMLKPNEDWCDIQDVIGVAIREIRDLMQNHPLEVHVPAELPLVRADFALIEHVLINLLENAAKYSPPGGDISISAYKTGNELLVRISNAGPAIPVLARRYIFDKFRRPGESEKQPGVGLGLSICKGIMEAHGGKIWLESSREERTSFIFSLPIPQQPDRHERMIRGDEHVL